MSAVLPTVAEVQAVVEDALEAAQRVVGEKAHVIDILDAAIDYLNGQRGFEATRLGQALCEVRYRGKLVASTSQVIAGYTIEMRDRTIQVCSCHKVSPGECPSIVTENLVQQGSWLKLHLDRNA
jgi:hypothetical protein